MSEQRSILQISARKTTHSRMCVCVFVCVCVGAQVQVLVMYVCVFLQVRQFVTKPMSVAHPVVTFKVIL